MTRRRRTYVRRPLTWLWDVPDRRIGVLGHERLAVDEFDRARRRGCICPLLTAARRIREVRIADQMAPTRVRSMTDLDRTAYRRIDGRNITDVVVSL